MDPQFLHSVLLVTLNLLGGVIVAQLASLHKRLEGLDSRITKVDDKVNAHASNLRIHQQA